MRAINIISTVLKKTILRSLIIFLTLIFISLTVSANYAPSLNWKTIETAHFLIHYHNGLENSASEISSYTEDIHDTVTSYFNWVPKTKTHIILSDQSETPNGSASVLPNNRIELFMTPPSDVSGLEDYQNWKHLVLKHEYAHIVHLDKAADLPLHGRSILGRYWLFFPNTFIPRWMSEGIATFIETENNKEIGRGQSSYFRGLMRNEVINGIKSLNQVNQLRSEWPGGTGFYLYGVYFFNFIRDTYGEEKIAEFVDNYSHFPIPYFINTVSKNTFGKNLFLLWNDFEIYLAKEFQDDLHPPQASSKYPVENIVTDTGYFSGYSKIVNNKLYFIRSNREQLKQLIERDLSSNAEKVIAKIIKQDYIFPHSFDVNKENEILIPLIEIYENHLQSFDLYSINTKTGRRTQLTSNKRYIRAIWGKPIHEDKPETSILALSNKNGLHHLDLLAKDGKLIKTLWQGQEGMAINSYALSPRKKEIVLSLFTPEKGWNLYLFDLEKEALTALTDNASIESYPQYTPDGLELIYSADYDDTYNIYQLNLETEEINRLTKTRSVKLFPAVNIKENNLYFTELDKNGFNLKQLNISATKFNKSTIKKQTTDYTTLKLDLTTNATDKASSYNGLKYLSPPWWLPLLIRGENQTSAGIKIGSSDPLKFHNYQVQLLYDFENMELRWNANYLNKRYSTYYLINSRRESFNSVYLKRRESETAFALIFPIIKRRWEWNFSTSVQHQNVELSTIDSLFKFSESDTYTTMAASVNTTTRNLRSTTSHDGLIAGISYELNEIEANFKQHSKVTIDTAIFSPVIKHAIFEARGIIVSAGGRSRNTYLGGAEDSSGFNNVFGKNNYALRGYGINQFYNTNLQKFSLKMHYPLSYPETGIMRPPFGLNRINLHTMFESARVGSFSNINSQNWLHSAALEIDFQSNFGFGRWPFNITAGVAKTLNKFSNQGLYTYSSISLNY